MEKHTIRNSDRVWPVALKFELLKKFFEDFECFALFLTLKFVKGKFVQKTIFELDKLLLFSQDVKFEMHWNKLLRKIQQFCQTRFMSLACSNKTTAKYLRALSCFGWV